MITSTRMLLSHRRLFLVLALLCLSVAAFAGLHAGGHDDSLGVCGLAGLGCAVAAALVRLPRLGVPPLLVGAAARPLASFAHPSRGGALPRAFDLSTLCCLRV